MKEDLIELENAPDTAVYLFTGFLEAGKTRFIQETLGDKRFNRGEKTLLLVCEEGIEEYDPASFAGKNVDIRSIDGEEGFTESCLAALQRELQFERVLIEYNGMWMLDTLYANMPKNWVVYQEFLFADCLSFPSYNANMRQLVYDKLKSCELVVFNRAPRDIDMSVYHKIVRGANRSCDIAFEHEDGSVEYDETVDPLPFDLDAPIVEIADRDYAVWYRDMGEELAKYDNKTVRFKCQLAESEELPAGSIIVGRAMMNCCAEDITFAGLVVEKVQRMDLTADDWVLLTARIKVKRHKAYGRTGPVLTALELAPAEPPEDEVAAFY